jgi:hypothetical protein
VKPATVVSVTYIDPRKGSNLAADSQFGFLFCEWYGSAAGVYSNLSGLREPALWIFKV